MHFRRTERHDRFVGGQKPPGKVAGSARFRCYRPGWRWPVGGPRKTASAAGRGTVAPCVRSICGDCRQCPLTAGVRWLWNPRPAWGRWRIGRLPVRPVLKHGPRSLTCARVKGCYETQRRSESKGRSSWSTWVGSLVVGGGGALPARLVHSVGEAEQERTRWDPKDGELCLSRMKPEETLVEVRSDSDVQIDRQTWV